MPRQLQVEFAGAFYHVMARGNRRKDNVMDDTDRQTYEACWEEAVQYDREGLLLAEVTPADRASIQELAVVNSLLGDFPR